MSEQQLQTYDNDEYCGWIPDELAESHEQTFAAFDRSVGGATAFDGDAFDAIRNGTARYDANRLPPLVTWPSLKEFLVDVKPRFERRRKEGLWKPPWQIISELGIDYPPANQLAYNSCSPTSFAAAIDDLQANQIGNRGDEFRFEKINGWYSYILTQKHYGGSLRSGRTMSAPARLAREIGQHRESIVGTYKETAGKWSVDENADPERSKIQACYCHIGDLDPEEQTDAIMLALWCDMVTNEGTGASVSQGGTVNGHPIGKIGSGGNHAQRSRCIFQLNGIDYIAKGNTHGIVSKATNGVVFPQDTLLLDRSSFVKYLGRGRYHDGIIVVYVESLVGDPKKGGLPS